MKLTVSRPEALALIGLLQGLEAKVYQSALTKLEACIAPPTTINASAGSLELAMLGPSRGKLVKMVTGSAYAVASKMATRLGVTTEDAAQVGKWLSAQGWLSQVTLIDVLRKWDTWLPKARALAAPRGVPEGFDGEPDIQSGVTRQRPTTENRRKPTL